LIRVSILLLPFIFASCGFENFDGIQANNLNERVFENSTVGQIVNGKNEIEANLQAVYISDISSKFKDYDVFLVSIYFFDKNIDGLQDIDYSFRLNGMKPIKIERISNDSRVISEVKLLNPWFKNYIIYFKKLKSEQLTLLFESNNFKSLNLRFTKGVGEKRDYPSLAEKLFSLPKIY